MTLAEMEAALARLVEDTSQIPLFAQMLNDALLEIAGDFDLPALSLLNPVELEVDTSDWLWDVPETFHKKLFRALNGNGTPISIRRTLDDLIALDPDHDETGDEVVQVAVRDTGMVKKLGIFPKADDTLQLWFYEKPTVMTLATDKPTCLPEEYHWRVLVTKCVIKNFQYFTDYIEDGPHKSLVYWENQYRQGLYGSRGGDIGFINYLVKAQGGPRRRGGRDPIGARW
jgi:hypothetical protein